MSIAEPPLSEDEQRYFLAEILKKSPLPPLHLAKFIEDAGITPSWNQMALPLGRSVAVCAETFDNLRLRLASGHASLHQPAGRPDYQTPAPKQRKRPVPSGDVGLTTDRTIQPRVPSFATVNNPNDLLALPSAPASTGEPPSKKKRGRPSRAEHEIRAAEAAARGESYPPPKKIRTPRPSAEGAAPIANLFTPVVAGPGGMEEGTASKKPARSKKPKKTAARNLSLEATAHAADQMQTQLGGETAAAFPEAEIPAQLGPERLLVDLQQHAALVEAGQAVEPERMDTGESGPTFAAGRETRREQQQQQQQQQQHAGEEAGPQHTAPEYMVYETHQRSPTAR